MSSSITMRRWRNTIGQGLTLGTSSRWPCRRSAARSPNSRSAPRLLRQLAAKRRADQLLVEQGLAESRAKAQALILAGLVSCAGRRVDKPGAQLAADALVMLKGRDHPWVSRGGVKLAHALDHFGISPDGKVALDI